jgi:large subunit ribosomal protein L5
MARLKDMYKSKIAPSLRDKYGYTTPMAIPHLEKIVVSMGLGRAVQDKKILEMAARDLAVITGQKPMVCIAKKSVSNFKVRQGDKTGLKVTLRKDRMYEFLDRLINLTIPRVKDFRGLNPYGFDGHGNYSMGLDEQSVFPEIDPSKIEYQQGMNITFVTSARSDDEAREMLRLFGMPFKAMS